MVAPANQNRPALVGEGFMCMFCGSRSNEKIQAGGCAGCGTQWTYGAVRALRPLQIITGFVFLLVAVFFFYLGAVAFQDIYQGERMSWGVIALVAGLGGTFFVGGVSSLLGKSWLLRMLLIFSGVVLRRRRPRDR
jgi:hypothetical protein